MMIAIIVCGVITFVSPWILMGKTKGIQEQIRLIATQEGEEISSFYGCRGCLQHVEFGEKYAPQLLKKIWIYDAGAILSFFIPAGLTIYLLTK